MSKIPEVKCVVVGDSGVGKSSLLETFNKGEFPWDGIEHCYDHFVIPVKYGLTDSSGCTTPLGLYDSVGRHSRDSQGHKAYKNADVALLCFSLVHPQSLSRVIKKWCPEVRKRRSGLPVILVGLKKDLRDDPTPDRVFAELSNLFETTKDKQFKKKTSLESVSHREGRHVADQIGAVCYLEASSAFNAAGLKEIFVEAARAGQDFQIKREKKKVCSVM